MKNLSLILGVLLLVYDVSAVDEVKSVAVMEGDSVTLNINDKETESAEELLWKIQGENKFIAKIDRETNEVSLNVNGRFSGRLEMDNKTGSLTINNITKADSRVYQLEIGSTSVIKVKRFNVTVSGEMETVSVREGETIILSTGLYEKQGYDPILWKFGDRPIANRLLTHESSDERFKGRLWLDRESGSLIIHNSRSTDSGVYHLDMSSSTYSVQRSINVTVSAPDKPTPDPGLSSVPDKPAPVSGLSSGAVAGIVVGLVLVFAAVIVAVVIYYSRKITELKGPKDVEKKETNVPLNAETANSDALQPL